MQLELGEEKLQENHGRPNQRQQLYRALGLFQCCTELYTLTAKLFGVINFRT